jgi:hypothetical protein
LIYDTHGENMTRKLSQLVGFFILAALMAACSQPATSQLATVAAPSPTVEPTTTLPPPKPTSPPVPGCNFENPPSFTDYASWTKFNDNPIKGHEVWANVYVNDLAQGIYLLASGSVFPACSKIVKTHLEGPESEAIAAITVMVKMLPGYDPDHNDWWWGMYDKTGKVAEMSGKVQVCIACHQPASEADYVFAKAVLAEANRSNR